jgi:glycosyltransferase involved in cell wall biosynthesis
MSRKIWWVNHYAITPERPGGTRHFDLGTELEAQGLDVRVFACDISLSTRKRTLLRPNQNHLSKKHGQLDWTWINAAEYEANNWKRAWNMISFSKRFRRAARKLAGKDRPSVIIGSSPHLFAAKSAMIVARRRNAKFVLELRDLWPQALIDMGEMGEEHKVVKLFRSLERELYRGADAFIILAEGSRKYLLDRGVPESKIHFIPNGVHLGHFQVDETREETRKRLGFDKFTIVYTGAHGPANTLQTVVEASLILEGSGIEFVLVGDGPSKADLVSDGGNVRFMDPVSKGEIPALLQAADAGVITLQDIPAFAYGVSPNKLFDYMGAQLPVLCSIPGDMAGVVERAEAGLIAKPEDAQDLADKALALQAMSDSDRAAMGDRGRACVEENFSRQKLAEQLKDMLTSL